MKFKRVLSGVILSAICVSMTGCKGSVDTSDPTYRLVGKLFDEDLPCYLGESVSKINKDFDDLLEEDSEMYDKYIEKINPNMDGEPTYYFKPDDIDIFGGIVSFPESCIITGGNFIISDEEGLRYIVYNISFEKYVEEKNMDISEKREFFHDICNQFIDAIVCDYDYKEYEPSTILETVDLYTDVCRVRLDFSFKSNNLLITIKRPL